MTGRIDRRRLLMAGGSLVAAGAVGGLTLNGCDFSTDPAGGADTAPVEGKGQAPELQRLVDEGKLPALPKRLPAEPLVVRPVDRAAAYGGTWRNALIGAGDAGRLGYAFAYENLVRWDRDWKKIIPNVAESFSESEDATRVTFRLRKGLRWSDGEPFTADDIEFAFRDLIMNKEIIPDTPGQYTVGGGPAKLRKIDAYTVEFTFAGPNALYLTGMANEVYDMLTRLPKHYLGQFHPDLSPDAEKAAIELDYAGPMELLQDALYAGMLWKDPRLPRLHAWLPDDAIGGGTRMRFTRNPYYFKVDPEGNQLPYLDGVDFAMAQDAEVVLLNVLRGDIDMIERNVTTTKNKPVLARDRAKGHYRFFDLASDKLNTLTIMLNLTCKDEAKREVFGSRDFRIGLSYAIDRRKVIKAVHARQGEPWQVAPARDSGFFDEEMAKQYTEYDPDKANEHLDRAGLRRDGDGPRRGPDGEPFSFRILVSAGAGKPELADALEIIKPMWEAVGVRMSVQAEDETLRMQLIQGNGHEALAWDGDGALDPVSTPAFFMPEWGENNAFCPEWFTWLATGGREGMEPPAHAKEQYRLYHEEIAAETDGKRRAATMKQILAIAKEQFYTIGISTPLPGYGVVGETFRNVPEKSFFAAKFPMPGAMNPEQFAIGA
ncbi:ABC transporter substrate-binding protein [Streptomyces sp. CNZ287]|uniref:ABC transporter substrate-binding protein n=1 Tax=Streptomyces sp. B22F1 TaxID=3153566 RepID=UPI0011A45E83